MNIVSYRGPSSAGGVSGALSRLSENTGLQCWWYLDGQNLSKHWGSQSQPQEIFKIPSRIVEGHYRYCNNFIWPILHGLPEFATYSSHDKMLYSQFNLIFANHILRSNQSKKKKSTCHINDYQLALTAKFMESSSASRDTSIFWHVPWPKAVTQGKAMLTEIAEGLLASKQIGFHITEYATNFLEFVNDHMPEYEVDLDSQQVFRSNKQTVTTIVVHPLGLDVDFWTKQIELPSDQNQLSSLEKIQSGKFVLSVDRMDYTKGVLQRIEAIDQFFCDHEDWVQKIAFVQVCQRSRPGLPAFDDYYQKCQSLVHEVNSRWQREDWQPIIWVKDSLTPAMLAQLYRKATAMLITPLRDGLNLTAKEFAACSDSGVLLLSPGAGVFHELGDHAVEIDPFSATRMSAQIRTALTMTENERTMRLSEIKQSLKQNTLTSWWQQFAGSLEEEKNVVHLPQQSQRSSEHAPSLLIAR